MRLELSQKTEYIPKQTEELVFGLAKASGFNDWKSPNITNMGALPIVEARGFGQAENQFFSLFGYSSVTERTEPVYFV